MIRDYHLHRCHFQDSNWRIQSINEMWIICVLITAGTHSTLLSQYISIPGKSLLFSGILTSPYGYGMDSALSMALLDVPISIYVVPNCRHFGHEPGNGQLVTVPVVPSTVKFTLLAASLRDCPRATRYVVALVQRKDIWSTGYATKTIAVVRRVLFHKH
jgi:hypothetical protein